MSPKFNSEEEAVVAHEVYHIDTDREGKFSPSHTGWSRTKKIIDHVTSVISKTRILGIGCNSGGLEKVILIKFPGSLVYGIDVQPELVERAKRKGIIAKVARGEKVPYPDDYFDVVLLSEILEHVFNPRKVLDEAIRVVKKGGLIVGSVPHPKGVNAKKGVEGHPYHARIFTKRDIEALLSSLGEVEITEIEYAYWSDGTPQWFVFKGIKCK